MAEDLARRADEALFDEDYKLAVQLYSQAIDQTPSDPTLYTRRARAHLKLSNYPDVVADTDKAIELRPTWAKDYFHKGVALFSLEKYATAKDALCQGQKLDPQNAQFMEWIGRCEGKLAECIKNVPNAVDISNGKVVAAAQSAPNDAPSQPKFKRDWYQNNSMVTITIYAKGTQEDNVNVDFGEQMLSVKIALPGEDPYHFQVRLFGKVIVPECSFKRLNTKIEIRLKKLEPITWAGLEYEKRQSILPLPSSTPVESKYPSSSKKPAKNWDKLEAEVKKQEKDEKLEGDAALNKLFRDIYQGADEDTRRAMNKSFVESNGTVLSTNWKEVGSKPIEGSAPQGMELKKWAE